MLCTMHDSQLRRRYILDRAGIMFVTDLTRHANIAQKCQSARNGRNLYINIFGNRKNATVQQ